jgi:3-oxoacyl-[acyl-carrier-protein] synthase-3
LPRSARFVAAAFYRVAFATYLFVRFVLGAGSMIQGGNFIIAKRALEAAGITAGDLDAFIPHQANMRITDLLVKVLKLPEHVPVARTIADSGNNSAATIPLAMERMLDDGTAPHGGLALLIGFGAGLVYAAQVVTLP